MDNKKLTNVARGTDFSDAITKHQLDTAMIDKHDNNQNIALQCHWKQKARFSNFKC